MKMSFVISTFVLTAGLAIMAGRNACADESISADPYAKLAEARTKTEIACRDSRDIFNPSRSGFDPALRAIQKTRDRIIDILLAARKKATENTIAECDKLAAGVEQKWEASSQEIDTGISDRYGNAVAAYENAAKVFGEICDVERKWKQAGIDLSPLEEAYSAIAKRIADIRGKAESAMADIKEKKKYWESEMEAAQKAVDALFATEAK